MLDDFSSAMRERFRETRQEEAWRSFAISLAIFTAPLTLVSVIWIYNADSVGLMAARVGILSPFGVLYVALITFCTIVWRGLISARQATYQQQQLEALARQIASSEENNLALLLQKGAEMLSDVEKRSHLAGGIATLQAVIAAENPKFVQEAMEVVADFIDEKFQTRNDQPLFRSAVKALTLGHSRKYKAARVLDFVAEDSDTVWYPFKGVTRISYTNGHTIKLGADELRDGRLRFTNTTLHYCDVPVVAEWQFASCTFRFCTIKSVALSKNGRAVFENCDFSDAHQRQSIVADVKFVNCHYRRDYPPRFPPEWIEQLSVRETPFDPLEAPSRTAGLAFTE